MDAAQLKSDVLKLTIANTEYSYTFPAGTKYFCIQARTAVDFRAAFAANKVAGPTDPYLTIFGSQGQTLSSAPHMQPQPAAADAAAATGNKVYLASGSAGLVLEIFYS